MTTGYVSPKKEPPMAKRRERKARVTELQRDVLVAEQIVRDYNEQRQSRPTLIERIADALGEVRRLAAPARGGKRGK